MIAKFLIDSVHANGFVGIVFGCVCRSSLIPSFPRHFVEGTVKSESRLWTNRVDFWRENSFDIFVLDGRELWLLESLDQSIGPIQNSHWGVNWSDMSTCRLSILFWCFVCIQVPCWYHTSPSLVTQSDIWIGRSITAVTSESWVTSHRQPHRTWAIQAIAPQWCGGENDAATNQVGFVLAPSSSFTTIAFRVLAWKLI